MKKISTVKGQAAILTIGSMNVDMVVRTDRIPHAGETLLGGKFESHEGGKGANQAVAARKLWKNSAFCAGVGGDSLGADYLKYLKKEGLDLSLVKICKGQASGVALIMVSKDGENIIAVAPGANMSLTPADIKRIDFKKYAYVVMQLETPMNTVGEALKRARAAGSKTILTPAPAQKLPTSCLKNIDILVPNEHEILLIQDFEKSDFEKAAAGLILRGVKNVIVTLGSKGCSLFNSDGVKKFGAFKVKPVDTVGAGDCFTGSLAAGLCRFDGDFSRAVSFASAAAALAVTKRGAQSFSSLSDVEKLLKKQSKGKK